MPSTPRHHAEWLSLLEISGPFLSMPVLMDVFSSGLNDLETDTAAAMRNAYEEWLETNTDPAIQTAWIRFVLANLLDYEEDVVLLSGQAVPQGLQAHIAQQGVTLRPDMVLVEPDTRKPRLLVQTYASTQNLDKAPTDSHWQASCASRMMEMLHALNVPLGLVTNGEQWMLVHAPVGETSGYISWYAELWFSERLTLRAFYTFLEAGRFFGVPDGETLEGLLQASAENQHEVTDQLGSQVRSAVQILIQALDKADWDRGRALLADVPEDRMYEAAITVMMRMVFMLFAEERQLFPVNERLYADNYAVSTLQEQLRAEADQYGEEVLERRFDAWCRLLAVARMVYGGVAHDRLNLPAYGGSLFDPDRFPFLEGRQPGTDWLKVAADPLPVDNRTVLHLLEAIQFLQIRVGGMTELQRLSFRALDIEQIGHVYEGLLEYKAARAAEIMVGLEGTKNYPLPIISLRDLETLAERDPKDFSKEIKDRTGKSVSALKNALKKEIDLELAGELRLACANDEDLYSRVQPFAHLLREDDYGDLVVIPKGSLYVTRGTTRRATGTHYTPRSLTEPIVQHTLEPLVYHGPAEGLLEVEWRLHGPDKLLGLKVCDMAMGSGSFLVQVIRYLSERIVESWEVLAPVVDPNVGEPQWITPEGVLQENSRGALPNDTDERLRLAKRLIADRCIYGVDKNPLAVEMGKLSIWLITLDRNRPFTFLNHALKCGDSLVGVDEASFLNWAKHKKDETAWSLFDEEIRRELVQARRKRRELEAFEVRDITDTAMKEKLLQEAEAATARNKLGCNLLVGVRLQDLSSTEMEAEESWLLLQWMAGETEGNDRCRRALRETQKVRAFHWFLEFPEVFDGTGGKGGFDAFVGNPPFVGGMMLSTLFGSEYMDNLHETFQGKGTADLCAYFFLQTYSKLRSRGCIGLIATNTIAQGDTRETGLAQIVDNNGVIYRANSSVKWPGAAAVYVVVVHFTKKDYSGTRFLDGTPAKTITSYLDTISTLGTPEALKVNDGKSFIGSYILGLGFTMSPEEARKLIAKEPRNQDVLLPYLIGKDLNTHPEQQPSRWVINFFDWPLEKAEQYPDCMRIVREKVKPQRDLVKRKSNRENWWIYAEIRPGLYRTIAPLERVLVITRVTKYVSFSLLNTNKVFSEQTVVLVFDSYDFFALLSSTIHSDWAWKYSSTMGDTTLRYSPSDIFDTFPFPSDFAALENIGQKYYVHRKQIMIKHNEGLTKTYNRFHDPEEFSVDIAHLRNLQIEMDQAVVSAYGWGDLDLNHDFHETPQGLRYTISDATRREVLTHLLKLNHQRYEEEVAQGLHEKKKTAGKKKAAKRSPEKLATNGQLGLGLTEDTAPQPEATLELAPRPQNALSASKVERWERYKCAACGKIVPGFDAENHIREVHKGVDVGFVKVGG
jgi:hypothetical protein